mgnify:CR=1 FL=1
MNRAVFLDRDGILNVDRGYTWRLSDLVVPDGVPESLSILKKLGFKLVVVTNQSGVARGKFPLSAVEAFNAALESEIVRRGGPGFDIIMTCPHHPDGSVVPYNIRCECRKPGVKLLKDASVALGIDCSGSFMIGDKWSDVLCGFRAGARPILVREAASLSYDLPEGVRVTRPVPGGEASRSGGIATSSETGDVEIYSSLSDAVSRVAGLES